MAKKKGGYRLVYVEWHDHWSEDAWTNVEKFDISKPMLCKSIGWLVKEDDRSISVAGSCANDDDAAQIMVILKSCIAAMRDVTIKKAKQTVKAPKDA